MFEQVNISSISLMRDITLTHALEKSTEGLNGYVFTPKRVQHKLRALCSLDFKVKTLVLLMIVTMMSADWEVVCFVWILPQILQSCQNQRQGRIALPRLDRDDDKGDFDADADVHIMMNCVFVCHKKQQR